MNKKGNDRNDLNPTKSLKIRINAKMNHHKILSIHSSIKNQTLFKMRSKNSNSLIGQQVCPDLVRKPKNKRAISICKKHNETQKFNELLSPSIPSPSPTLFLEQNNQSLMNNRSSN